MTSMFKLTANLLALGAVVSANAGDGDGYPASVSKELYATNDLRGKAAPKLYVEKWLTGEAPATKGKVVLLEFWATWCPPCRQTIPELGKYQKEFGNDLVVIGVSAEDPQTVLSFMKATKMPYNVAIDASKRMESAIGVKGIPHALVITPDHIVRWQGFPISDQDPLTDKLLAQIIGESKKEQLAKRR